ncbi:MAG: 4-hydroxythreonine-4-phosphate dehydrogenase PdxA [Alphaproteobacteria bacterium]|nr:4-hydroxythreonine-4-phosphate dehydrogenase PdxA [Alphaproteobacteria bacterium]MBL6939950.1 4-hydroxythreonine-4-phosphate dehydrogenase PdxA [Alphaproteobacteria bacterium]MBL7099868.1 4-hydroxythreonine-4-phosphate dehydrogenase PdxA [Alphaproteobacteria bacterium]
MSKSNSKPILITMGEPAGIGPEVAVAAYKGLGGRIGTHPLKLVGAPNVFDGFDGELIRTKAPAVRVPGKPEPNNGQAVIQAIELAVGEALAGEAAAVVTAPINKAALARVGFAYPGHTEFLQALTNAPRAVMMLAGETLRVVPLTVHMPIADVPKTITTEAIVETGEIILAALKREFGIASPRLAVAGLNPHAGEDGVLGGEDGAIIVPAIGKLRTKGHEVRGPLSADTLFHAEARARYDAALCMYHDQALIPIKTLSFWDGVNVTLGLPIVRTSPDHGTALDIAGTGKADARSMIAAIRMAAAMADARAG